MGKVPQSRYTMGLSIPATYLVYLAFCCKSNCIVVKPRIPLTPSQVCALGGAGEVCGAGGTCEGRQTRSREIEGGSKEKHGRNRST